jgi:Flp pilus assembly protein TadG
MFETLKRKLESGFKRSAAATGFIRRQEGAAAVEFAIVAAPFMALVMAILQTALVYYAGQVLDTAVADASRIVLTGSVQSTSMTQTQFADAVCKKIPGLFDCSGLMIDVQTVTSFANANTAAPVLTFDAAGKVTNGWQYNPGNAGDIVVMRVMYQWPVPMGPLGFGLANVSNGNLLLLSTAVFKNEPF